MYIFSYKSTRKEIVKQRSSRLAKTSKNPHLYKSNRNTKIFLKNPLSQNCGN